jgi:hypothetical protein
MHCELYSGKHRDADFNKEEWLRSKLCIASLWAMAYASNDFSKFLKSGEECKTAEQLSIDLAALDGPARLSVNVLELTSVAERLGQPGGQLGSLQDQVQSFIKGYEEKFGAANGGERENERKDESLNQCLVNFGRDLGRRTRAVG